MPRRFRYLLRYVVSYQHGLDEAEALRDLDVCFSYHNRHLRQLIGSHRRPPPQYHA